MFLPPAVSKLSGPIAALTHGTLSGGVNWPGSSDDPELHMAFVHACNACLSPLGLVKPPKEFSDLDYVMGTDGVQFRPILGGGEGLAADAPQGRAARRAEQRPVPDAGPLRPPVVARRQPHQLVSRRPPARRARERAQVPAPAAAQQAAASSARTCRD